MKIKKILFLFLNYLPKLIDINYQKNTEIIISLIEFLNDNNFIIKKVKNSLELLLIIMLIFFIKLMKLII